MTDKIPLNVLAYRERVLKNVSPYFTGESLLDVGCGDGFDTVPFSKHFSRTEATDIFESNSWKGLSEETGIIFKKGNAERLDYPSGSFTTVMEKDMLHHASDPFSALKEMVRVSSHTIIVLEANRYNPIFYLHLTLMGNHQHFTQKKFREIIAAAGLPHELRHFSARVCPINNKFLIDLTNGICDIAEKLPFYRPVIEYNMAVIRKK